MGVSAYKSTIKNTSSPREIERKVLSQVTGKLERIYRDFDSAEDKRRMLSEEVKEAIWDNQKLWITLKADLMAQENALPSRTRADLISLALWVDKHSWEVMRGNSEIEPLIDVNRAIIAGLQGRALKQG